MADIAKTAVTLGWSGPLLGLLAYCSAKSSAYQFVHAVPWYESIGGGSQARVDGAPDHQLYPPRGNCRVECPFTLASFDLGEDQFVDLSCDIGVSLRRRAFGGGEQEAHPITGVHHRGDDPLDHLERRVCGGAGLLDRHS
ncbi:hypothetical protein G3I77_37545 [Streptomyces sp. D2-8]|uniref:hypothetical protein n=1 Tax=Streptomyces sp. D2-8 TaxID=2707767 RepID=UPI0020C0344E|nr:hypothetical protein [Streptomyces sp. D2-8]MCK8438500.1 hypothetical protein [Streptomyces sp. D2-8]